jgi:glycine/sarcosine N-methyltransferase
MARTTDSAASGYKHVVGFYDWLAPEYDLMTEFEKRFVQETPFFRLLVERYSLATAVDAGAGTGFHSLLLARLGVGVTAVDISPLMIQRLKEHARTMGLTVRGVVAPFTELPEILRAPADAVFCLGNTLAHCLTREELLETLRSFARVLRPGGVLVAQTLNYDRILAKKEPIQSVKEINGKTFVRSYEYHRDTIRFNILKLERDGSGIHHSLESVDLRPLLVQDLVPALKETGFPDVRTYGGITLEDFIPGSSKDLVVLARKGT